MYFNRLRREKIILNVLDFLMLPLCYKGQLHNSLLVCFKLVQKLCIYCYYCLMVLVIYVIFFRKGWWNHQNSSGCIFWLNFNCSCQLMIIVLVLRLWEYCFFCCFLSCFGNKQMLNVTFQERAQCRMVMIQDGQFLNAPEKPLRIMGDPMRAQRGKDLVQDLLTEKELEVSGQTGERNWKVIMVMQEFVYKSESCFMLYESHWDPLILLLCNNNSSGNNKTLKLCSMRVQYLKLLFV